MNNKPHTHRVVSPGRSQGTVFSISKRAEAAVIGLMRHQTMAYDLMSIARVKGKRRELRRQLSAKFITLLQACRQGRKLAANYPLTKTLL